MAVVNFSRAVKTRIDPRGRRRQISAGSVVELLTSIIVSSIAFGAIAELAVLTTRAALQSDKSISDTTVAQQVIERINADVRQARIIGNLYANRKDTYSIGIDPTDSTGHSVNPIYNGSHSLSLGLPGYPWPSTLTLSPTVLIVQTPVFYENASDLNDPRNGVPLALEKDHFAINDPQFNTEMMNTSIYAIVPDLERSGQFMLQLVQLPGNNLLADPKPAQYPSRPFALINPPQTLLKGIVGPKAKEEADNPTALPHVFSYIKRGATADFIFSSTAVMPDGVAVDLNIQTNARSSGAQVLAMHDEAFVQNSKNMILLNTTIPEK